MKNISKRIKRKILLWVHFHKICANFWSVVWVRIITILKLSKIINPTAKIILKNGVKIDYGHEIEISTVPVLEEIWHDKIYNPTGYEINPTDIVFDIGANVGNFAIYAAQQTTGKVYAFEPVPQIFALLQKNIQLNNLSNIQTEQLAVAGSSGIVNMHISVDDTAHSITHKANAQRGDIQVQTITLEEYCDANHIEKIDFLKVDSEGAEYDMFAKMSDRMFSKLNKVAIEHHERLTGINHNQIIDQLTQHGFTVMELPDQYIFGTRSTLHNPINTR